MNMLHLIGQFGTGYYSATVDENLADKYLVGPYNLIKFRPYTEVSNIQGSVYLRTPVSLGFENLRLLNRVTRA